MSLSDNDEPVHADSETANSLQTQLTRRSISRAAPPPGASSGAPPSELQTEVISSERQTSSTTRKKKLAGFDDIRASLERLQASVRRSGGIKKLDKTRTLNPRGADVIKVLSDQCEQAFAQIAKKEEDLKLAAEIGQHLLNKVDENMQAAASFEQKLAQSTLLLDKHKEEKRQFERQEKRLKMMLEDIEVTNKRLEQQLAASKEALDRAKGRSDARDEELVNELEQQIRDLTEANSKLTADNEKMASQLKLERENYEFLLAEVEQNRERLQQMTNLETTIGNLRKKLASYEKLMQKHSELEWECKHVHETLRELSAAYNRMQEQQADDQRRMYELQSELDLYRSHSDTHSDGGTPLSKILSPRGKTSGLTSPRAPSIAEEMEEDENQTPSKKPGLIDRLFGRKPESSAPQTEVSEDVANQTPPGYRRRSNTTPYGESGSALFEEKDEASGGYFGDEDERGGSGPVRTYGRGGGASSDSLAGSGAGSISGSSGLVPTDDHPLAPGGLSGQGDVIMPLNSTDEQGRKYHDANKEFFFLTALAIKLNTGDIMEHIQTVSTKQLYEKAIAQQVPFHQYAAFIEREITHAYIERIYNHDEFQSSNERSELVSPRRSVVNRQRSTGSTHMRHSSTAVDFRAAGANLAASKPRYQPKFVKNTRKSSMM